MLDFATNIEIKAPAERVWSVMRDVERWPEWTPTVTRIRRTGNGPLAVGSRATIWQPKLLPARWEVVELKDNDRTFTWMTRGPGMRLFGRHSVEPTRDGSRATLSLKFTGPLGGFFARLTRRLNERYLALEAQGLKQQSEASVHP
jgi:carbon monoxide dehydrogenase subunit G